MGKSMVHTLLYRLHSGGGFLGFSLYLPIPQTTVALQESCNSLTGLNEYVAVIIL